MKNRRLILSLPADLIRQARVYATEHAMTINSLVRELLQEALSRENRARAATDRLLALADRGPYFTTDPGSAPREQLHERR